MNKLALMSAATVALATGMLLADSGQANAAYVTKVNGGLDYAQLVRSDGSVWGYGYDFNGKIGDGGTVNSTALSPMPVSGFANGGTSIDAGYNHTLFLKSDGSVWAAGDNNYGQGGATPSGAITAPLQVAGLSDVVEVAGGEHHSLALTASGDVYGFGGNYNGQLGNGTATNSSTPVKSLISDVKDIAAGARFSLALKTDGTVWAWGNNASYQYGKASNNSTRPSQVPITGVTAIDAGKTHAVAIKADGTVWYWGTDTVGLSTAVTAQAPTQVRGFYLEPFTGATAIAAGHGHTLILKNDATVWSFGNSTYGQLGHSYAMTGLDARPVQDMTGVQSISAGSTTSYALRANGSVWAWGSNAKGQFGNGTTTSSNYPVEIKSLTPALTAEAIPSYMSIQLNYSYDGPVAEYRVYTGANQLLYMGTKTTFEHKGLTNVTAYTYTIYAYDANGNELAKSTLSATTKDGTVNVWHTGSEFTSIQLGYSGRGPVAKFVVTRDNQVLYEGKNTTFIDTGLLPNKPYYYVVSSYDANGVPLGQRAYDFARTKAATGTLQMTSPDAHTMTTTYTGTNFEVGKMVLRRMGELYYEGTGTFTESNLMPHQQVWYDYELYDTNGVLMISTRATGYTQNLAWSPLVLESTSTSVSFETHPTNANAVDYVIKKMGSDQYSGPESAYHEEGLTPGTTYYYSVYAYTSTDHALVNLLGTYTFTVITPAADAPQ
ncbi:RCC1 domain-containing protein [Tumebacillus avium]|nr:hypothetical protein [Tumebacillus avium]